MEIRKYRGSAFGHKQTLDTGLTVLRTYEKEVGKPERFPTVLQTLGIKELPVLPSCTVRCF